MCLHCKVYLQRWAVSTLENPCRTAYTDTVSRDNESPQSIRSGSDSSEDKGSDEESTMQTHPDPKRIDEQRLLSGGYIKVRSS